MIIGSPTEFAVIVANHSVIGESRHDTASIEGVDPADELNDGGGNWFSMTHLICRRYGRGWPRRADAGIEALLDGLAGDARGDRAELIGWLLDRGFTVDQIGASLTPMMLPANRVMGDDGVYVSTRETSRLGTPPPCRRCAERRG